MEHLEFEYSCKNSNSSLKKEYAMAGVVGSGNLEVMIEKKNNTQKCCFVIDSSADGFQDSWAAVTADFAERHQLGDLQISINDNAASPAVVSLRMDQALEAMGG